MRKPLALAAAGVLVITGCAQPREQSSVDVTPPPEVEIPAQHLYYEAMTETMDDEAIISTGGPAIETLNTAAAELEEYSPEPSECAGTVDPEYYTTHDVAVGFVSESDDEDHTAKTVFAADFDTAEDATEYFNERTRAWTECDSVDLTIDDTNVLTLHYSSTSFSDTDEVDVPDSLNDADQDLVLSSTGELSGEFEAAAGTVAAPAPETLPDYVISPDDVPEPEAENISVTSATVVARFDQEVFWITVEPGSNIEEAAATLAELTEAVQEAS